MTLIEEMRRREDNSQGHARNAVTDSFKRMDDIPNAPSTQRPIIRAPWRCARPWFKGKASKSWLWAREKRKGRRRVEGRSTRGGSDPKRVIGMDREDPTLICEFRVKPLSLQTAVSRWDQIACNTTTTTTLQLAPFGIASCLVNPVFPFEFSTETIFHFAWS